MKTIMISTISVCLALTNMVSAQESLGVYSHKVGLFELILLAESQGQGNKSILIGATPEMLREYAPTGTFPNAMNAFLVKTPGQNILIDAGLGRKLVDNLQALNVAPGQVDVILITHMHGDHIGGLLRDGNVIFPQAEIYLPQPEYDYWMSDGKFKQQQEVIAAYKTRLHLFKPNELDKESAPLLPGFTAYAAYGHTPGHTAFLLESGNEKMFVWGDVTHAMALQMPYPQVAVTYDVNPDDAIAARKQVLEYVTQHKIPIAGMHIAFPAMGTISKGKAGGYLFTPFTK
ncbi:MAG: MBL fold metallo-hydrolase [Tannerellaceae bacterium]|nr:MBL fold metallo-hydrolase [Tannerellaceae bacterium]